ncbi:possible tyrosine transporter P-protein [Peptoclostridium litorale DSM 5388]|uniref:Na+/H+ antiporter NhaD type n=1 Tax=Peptoclostridium litorale DSM 5388 TaxID=1121324 RepID=A0A069RK21_PEPLI|nr:ArsB/NhaD family transporter [Peptoclostridium litorale]KDR96485.1 Na+/H+ antiporter NhaD type [Peptoclostridium litorale DSM 5388]SIN70040.1 possible tyrosine transporter P-protein [Peptoclostridium litorale DSM 5388]
MFSQTAIVLAIFIATYVFIISEKIDRTIISFFGATMLILLGIMSQEEALLFIDFNTIGLLIGMMTIVNILKTTGVFQYIAIKTAKLAKGDPWRIIMFLCIVTAVLSAFLDNVTTVLLIAPVTLVITETLEVNPLPFLVPQIISSNIGGTGTLVGDPPNIMIGSISGLGFMDFMLNTGPIALIILFFTIIIFKFIYGKKVEVDEDLKSKLLMFDEKKAIKEKSLLVKSLSILFLTLVGFSIHETIGLESASVALIGASTMLLVSGANIEIVLHEIEWPTIFFFAFLFILIGGLEKVGIIDMLAEKITETAETNFFLTAILMLWGSAIISSFLDNIPFVATMIPLISKMAAMSTLDVTPLWWALSLGACLGGNGSLIGASANVIVAGILEKSSYKLSFIDYLKIGFPMMIISIIMASFYLVAMYL